MFHIPRWQILWIRFFSDKSNILFKDAKIEMLVKLSSGCWNTIAVYRGAQAYFKKGGNWH